MAVLGATMAPQPSVGQTPEYPFWKALLSGYKKHLLIIVSLSAVTKLQASTFLWSISEQLFAIKNNKVC